MTENPAALSGTRNSLMLNLGMFALFFCVADDLCKGGAKPTTNGSGDA